MEKYHPATQAKKTRDVGEHQIGLKSGRKDAGRITIVPANVHCNNTILMFLMSILLAIITAPWHTSCSPRRNFVAGFRTPSALPSYIEKNRRDTIVSDASSFLNVRIDQRRKKNPIAFFPHVRTGDSNSALGENNHKSQENGSSNDYTTSSNDYTTSSSNSDDSEECDLFANGVMLETCDDSEDYDLDVNHGSAASLVENDNKTNSSSSTSDNNSSDKCDFFVNGVMMEGCNDIDVDTHLATPSVVKNGNINHNVERNFEDLNRDINRADDATDDVANDISADVAAENGSEEEEERESSSPKEPEETSPTGSDDILAINPEDIEIYPVSSEETPTSDDPMLQNLHGSYPFVNMFRGSAMYIANYCNTAVVYHISGDLLEWDGFQDLINDMALTWLLGMKITIVLGCGCFVDRRLMEMGAWPPERHGGVRVTNYETLRIVKEEAGFVRFEVERCLARALRQGSYFDAKHKYANVVSGNFFSAQPFGVVDGVDYEFTGLLRRVEVEKIQQAHNANDIVLLTNLGVSPSGELFNVNSESLASGVAGALKAQKIVFFSLSNTRFRNTKHNSIIYGLRQKDAQRLLDENGVKVKRGGYAVVESDTEHHPAVIEALLQVGWSLNALKNGVKRAHIIPPCNGALLQELFTRDGAGTLISRDLYDGIRRANVNDVAGIYDLIEPLIKMGTLIDRPLNVLEKDIKSYFVFTRDNLIVACGQLHKFEGGFAEIGCLVVHKDYRSQGRGDAMLGYLERLCVQSGATNVFVLSTQTMQFFVERGFREIPPEKLPPSKLAKYNNSRRSKIFLKKMSDRDLDADELMWDR
eukprot:CAMPEP_0195506972 /NCGR_PEP_ID=MMETSP0794_2-20130614/495_1 /TAXON_ID=515487 /ORGANISM="Stephanopyxis turris, Strain CCMP 815" /LENGTH=815 /DNA_ID=CAMNT_0040633463 /DNA_START=93 /DNA_END=2540 /DNA_ORIENTATION=-